MIKKNQEIKKSNIILCEGRDVTSFIINYLGFLIKKDGIFDEIQAMDFGGIAELTDQIGTLVKMPSFSMVRSVLIIRDAERDYTKAKANIKGTYDSFGVAMPGKPGEIVMFNDQVKTSYLLLPSLDDIGEINGTLEDLCLELIMAENHEAIQGEVENYLKILQNEMGMKYPRIHKNKLHLMISSYDKYVDAKAGEAGQRGMYDFDSPKLDYLKDTMRRMSMTIDSSNQGGV